MYTVSVYKIYSNINCYNFLKTPVSYVWNVSDANFKTNKELTDYFRETCYNVSFIQI